MTRSAASIACFITCHGFGHATRSAAVMAALERIQPGIRFEIFTNCPAWIFKETLSGDFGYHDVRVDIGVVQRSPLEEDLEATCRRLKDWLPFDTAQLAPLAKAVKTLACRLLLCDISPLGIAVAKHSGLPGVLVENFTWDWIYDAYRDQAPELDQHIAILKQIYAQADMHFQTDPCCRPIDGARLVPPVGRSARATPEQIRTRLNIPAQARMVLVSMGGVPDRFHFLSSLPDRIDPYLVIPGADHTFCRHPKIILLPANSTFYHPDLMCTADLLIGKAGYSTIAEAYHCGVPYGYIIRPDSPESSVLADFIRNHLSARPINIDDYLSGRWLKMLPDLLQMQRHPLPQENGADVIARVLWDTYLK